MSNNKYIILIIRFAILLLLQAFVFDKIQLFGGKMIPFPYIYAMLLLPFSTARWIFLVVGFVYGFAIDAFSHTLGMHTSAAVFLGYLLPQFRSLIAPIEGYAPNATPTIESQGIQWFLIYISAMTFAHHFWLFFIESFQWVNFLDTLLKIVLSSVFTIGLILIFHFLTFKSNKSRN